MREDYTDITVILDRSGSMQRIKADMEGGFATFLADQRRIPGKATLTLVQFDDQYDVSYTAKTLQEAPSLKLDPRGTTALYDAIGRTINETGARLAAMPATERPAKVIMLIITDGEENASREFDREKVFQMIKHQKDRYAWEFVFLGADQDALKTGASLGISADYSMTFAKSATGVAATYSSLSSNIAAVRSSEYIVGSGFFKAEDRAAQVNAGMKWGDQ